MEIKIEDGVIHFEVRPVNLRGAWWLGDKLTRLVGSKLAHNYTIKNEKVYRTILLNCTDYRTIEDLEQAQRDAQKEFSQLIESLEDHELIHVILDEKIS